MASGGGNPVARFFRQKNRQIVAIRFVDPVNILLTLAALMGEGFILFTRGYEFMGGCTTPLLTR